MKATLIKKLSSAPVFKLAATFGIVSLVAVWIYGQRKKNEIAKNALEFDPLSMERYIFDWNIGKKKYNAEVIHEADTYRVKINGTYAGSMFRDQQDGSWRTDDEALSPHLNALSAQLSTLFSLQGFPAILKGNYPQIISTNWKTSETLELQLDGETDIEVFASFLADEVPNLVTFPEYMDLIVKKEDDAYFKIISVNMPRS